MIEAEAYEESPPDDAPETVAESRSDEAWTTVQRPQWDPEPSEGTIDMLDVQEMVDAECGPTANGDAEQPEIEPLRVPSDLARILSGLGLWARGGWSSRRSD